MDSHRIDELLFEAAELDPENRPGFLERECGEDEALRRELESLLFVLEDSRGFLDSPPQIAIAGDPESETPELDRSGDRVGAYLLTELLGEGGMGAVYLAQRADGAFEKKVAVKLIRNDSPSGDLARRFLTERQALAALEHPNIARLLDGGTGADGTPYLVMENVEDGVPIDRACRDRGLSTNDRLRLFLDVCDAVQYAHGKLVVHRDIKPSNVLLDAEGKVKLLDFGIAKILGEVPPARPAEPAAGPGGGDGTIGGRALTPAFASPEQLAGEPITTATDVYSLGVLLHVLLTGELPPPEGVGEIAGDLGFILDKALSRRPEDRYTTAEKLASDVRSHLEDQPVAAAPDSRVYRVRKFYRRHRLAVLAGVAVAAALVLATGVSTRFFFAASAARHTAEAERETAQQVSDFLASVLGSIDPNVAQGRDVSLLAEVIDRTAARIPRELAEQPQVQATLHGTLGGAYKGIARYEAAERELRRAVEIRRAAGGSELPASLAQLGSLLIQLSRHEEAEVALREAVELASRLGTEGALVRASALTDLGDALSKQGTSEEAERVLRQALQIRRRELPPDHPALAHSLDRLGWLLATTDRAAESEAPLIEAVRIRRLHADDAPVALGLSLSHLGYAYRVQGKFDAAQELYEEYVVSARRLLGPDHPNLGTALSHLASLHEFRGDYEAAEPLYLEALETQRRGFGEIHREVGTTLNNLGGLQRRMGRFDAAEESLRQAMSVYSEALGEDHPWVAIAEGNLVRVFVDEGDWAAADRTVADYLERARALWPAEHWRVAAFESMRGACLLEMGRYEAAEPVLLESYERLRRGLGEAHEHTRDARERLVLLLEATGREAQAAAYRGRGEAEGS